MTKDRGGIASRHLRLLFSVGTVAGLSDAQLLEWFTTRKGEAAELAFAALLERHGPMVLRVCRGVLTDPHDAQDAFQAAFLGNSDNFCWSVRTLRIRGSDGSWHDRTPAQAATLRRADGCDANQTSGMSSSSRSAGWEGP